MKKILLPVSLLVLVFLAAAAGWLLLTRDREGPEIVFDESGAVTYHSGMTNEELLQGVTAEDYRDGDVTDSLMVESVRTSEENDRVTVTYVAVDKSKNITRASRELPGTGETQEEAEQPANDAATGESEETAEVPEEPAAEEQQDPEAAAVAEREEKIEALSPDAPRFYLKQHQVSLTVGESFSALDWVEEIMDDRDDRSSLFRNIQIDGSVDTSLAGTYELTYYAVDSDGNRSNEEVMTVTVMP
ncbi:MAG: immunoglobulin-like domain-containing protein [Ruminococcus sp.]|jgi:hypothetical protein